MTVPSYCSCTLVLAVMQQWDLKPRHATSSTACPGMDFPWKSWAVGGNVYFEPCPVQDELCPVRACAHCCWKCPPPRLFWGSFIPVWVDGLGIRAGIRASAVIYGACPALPCWCSASRSSWPRPRTGGLEKTVLSCLRPGRHCICWDRWAKVDMES